MPQTDDNAGDDSEEEYTGDNKDKDRNRTNDIVKSDGQTYVPYAKNSKQNGDYEVEVVAKNKSPRKYYHALNALKPVRFNKIENHEFPQRKAGLFNLMTVHWMTSYVWKIYCKGSVKLSDLWNIAPEDSCQTNCQRLERFWHDEVSQRGMHDASLEKSIWRFCQTRMIVSAFLKLLELACSFVGPTFLLRALLVYIEVEDTDLVYGMLLVLALFCTDMIRSIFFITHFLFNVQTSIQVHSAIVGILYHKILRLRTMQDKSVGQLLNLFSNDTQRMLAAFQQWENIFCGLIIVFAATAYCVVILGPWALVGTAVLLMFYPYQVLLTCITTAMRSICIKITDQRIRLMNEIFTCIKLIKLYAWEKPFAKAVAEVRKKEQSYLEKLSFIDTMALAMNPIVPSLAAIVTFTAHTSTGNNLTASQAFVFLTVFNLVRIKLGSVPFAVRPVIETRVAMKRFKSVLSMDESQKIDSNVSSADLAVEVANGNFAWDIVSLENNEKLSSHKGAEKEKQKIESADRTESNQVLQVLHDISLKIHKGKLYGVCGGVGSGKSSLISALLGHMIHMGGHVAVSGSLAYVAQQAWIMNATVKENILFGQPFQQERYQQILDHCCLEEDLKALPAGDMTEIGERGINLSGGQKQRVSLARAVYMQSDIYLLDDPLSAVDAHVAHHIFHNVIKTLLQGKTILLVTHQLKYLEYCDHVIIMKDGRFHEEGIHLNLMEKDGEYASLVKKFRLEDKQKSKDTTLTDVSSQQDSLDIRDNEYHTVGSSSSIASLSSVQSDLCEDVQTTDGKLVADEEIVKGAVSSHSYIVYIKGAGGVLICFLVMIVFALPAGVSAFSSWWLAHWINQGNGNLTSTGSNLTRYDNNISDNPHQGYYTFVYGMMAVVLLLALCARGFLYMKVTLNASTELHDKVFAKVLGSPMSFFDTVPIGRLINRFTRDMNEIDVMLPIRTGMILQNIMIIFSIFVIVAMVFPWFLLYVLVIMVLFWGINLVFRAVLRQLKRLDSVSRSPLFSWLSASIQGLHTIQAYGKKEDFLVKFRKLLDESTVAYTCHQMCHRFFTLRLAVISCVAVTVTGICVVLTKGKIPAAMAALALSYASQLVLVFQFTVRMLAETESSFVAVERIDHYIQNVESEAATVIKDSRPPTDWPQEGTITYKNYRTRYRPGLPSVLKGISFEIQPSEKIGIVGRTGSGKSTLGLSIFRIIEPDSGSITIDGIDISTIGLSDLRSHLSIIPQDPVLFIGTVRYNLDPFNQFQDDELWLALEKCHMKDKIKQLEGQLQSAVVENGENFSLGERQLLCITRALVRKCKVLVLDEATAAIDSETDMLIQATIREVFVCCTVLTIAHRINTILDSHRVMVLDKGKIVEFDDPQELLKDSSSYFSQLVKANERQSFGHAN